MLHPDVRAWLERHPPKDVVAVAAPVSEAGADAPGSDVAHAFVCECGSSGFRVLAVPAAMAGAGPRPGLLRFVTGAASRVWRELAPGADAVTRGEALAPPIAVDCASCGRRHVVVPGADPAAPLPPLEAHRCRPCRRSTFEVVARYDYAPLEARGEPEPGDAERFDRLRLGVACRACGRRADELYVLERRDARRRALDELYGREPAG